VKSQADKIADPKVAYAYLKREKENITSGYRINTRPLLPECASPPPPTS
jgi:hypothetical protein